MASMATLGIRLASTEDYQELLELSEGIYDGHDYLPFVFHRWLQMQNRLVFVALLGSKVIGIASVASIDEGATCFIEGVRIHPTYRGQGVGSRLVKGALQRFWKRAATLTERERYVIRADNSASLVMMKKIDPSRRLHECWQQYLLRLPISEGKLRFESLDFAAVESTRPCSKQDLLTALLSGDNKRWFEELFPGGLVMLQLKSFNVMIPSNWDGIFENGTHVFLDKESDPQQHHGLKAISFGRSSQQVKSMAWETTICSTNQYSFKAHLGRQLQLARECLHGKEFGLELCCDEGFVSVAKSFLRNEMGLEGSADSYCYLVLERHYKSRL